MPSAKRAGRARLNIAVVTGTRSEYGLLRSTLRALQQNRRVRLHVIATGMHLLREFGNTRREIARDGFQIAARVPMQRGNDAPLDQAEGLARGVSGIARALARLKADIVLVLGDRIEALAGALAGATTGRVVAHIHGGDVAEGDFDESVRHAITKLAHLHFVASPASRKRVLAMGESPERVFLVGAPGLDEITASLRSAAAADRGERPGVRVARGKIQRSRSRDDDGFGREIARGATAEGGCATCLLAGAGGQIAGGSCGYAVILQHALGRAANLEERVMRTLLDEVARTGLRRVVIHPNTDRGHRGVLAAIARHKRGGSNAEVTVYRSLPRGEFLELLRGADFLIGNSSSGIIEAPSLGTPSIDVGDRQGGREPGGNSVIHADESAASIRMAIKRARKSVKTSVRGRQSGPYGDGRAGKRIAHILAQQVGYLETLRRKRWNGDALKG